MLFSYGLCSDSVILYMLSYRLILACVFVLALSCDPPRDQGAHFTHQDPVTVEMPIVVDWDHWRTEVQDLLKRSIGDNEGEFFKSYARDSPLYGMTVSLPAGSSRSSVACYVMYRRCSGDVVDYTIAFLSLSPRELTAVVQRECQKSNGISGYCYDEMRYDVPIVDNIGLVTEGLEMYRGDDVSFSSYVVLWRVKPEGAEAFFLGDSLRSEYLLGCAAGLIYYHELE